MLHCDTNFALRSVSGYTCALACGFILGIPGCDQSPSTPNRLTGLVFHDADASTVRNDREKGLARVPVSNGREVVLTDVRGRWALPMDGPRSPFVIAPRGWQQTPSTDPALWAMQPWHPSPTPTVHIIGPVDKAPPADATVGFGSALAALPNSSVLDTLPTAFNVGNLHVVVVDDSVANPDNLAFVEADLLHAGAARPVLLLLRVGRGDVVALLGARPRLIEALGVGEWEAHAVGLNAQGAITTYGLAMPTVVAAP